MYFEDLDLGDRLGQAGWQNVYVPAAVVVHAGGHAARRDPRRMAAEHHRSACALPVGPLLGAGVGAGPMGPAGRSGRAGPACADGCRRSPPERPRGSEWATTRRQGRERDDGRCRCDRARGRYGHAAAAADPVGAQADAADRRGAVAHPPARPHPRRRRQAHRAGHVSYRAEVFGRLLRRRFGAGRRARVRRRDRAARHRRRHPQRRRPAARRHRAVFNGDVLSGVDLRRVAATAPATGRRRDPLPDQGRRPARVRLRADRRRRPGARRSSRRTRTRSPTRSTPAPTCSAARCSRRSRPVDRCRSSARRSPGCWPRARRIVGLRRLVLLARPRHAGRLRRRLGRPGARSGAVARRCPVPVGESLVLAGAPGRSGRATSQRRHDGRRGLRRRGRRGRRRRRRCSTGPASAPARWCAAV